MKNFVKSILIDKGIFLLAIIIGYYAFTVSHRFFQMPFRPDNIWYVGQIACPHEAMKLFFRYWNYYLAIFIAKSLGFIGFTCLRSAAYYSLLCHIGIIAISFFIILKVSNRTSALIAAILISCVSFFIYQATVFGPDVTPTLLGLCAFYFSLGNCTTAKSQKCWKYFFSGFLLLMCVFSKLTGLVFVMPVLLVVISSCEKRKILISFTLGAMISFITLNICDGLFLGDFFYHFSLENYHTYFQQLSSGIDEYVKLDNTNWNRTFFEVFRDHSNMHYVVFVTVSICLFSFSKNCNILFDSKRIANFSLLAVAICSLLFHELVHIQDTILTIHDRWCYTVLVPFILFYAAMTPTLKHSKMNKKLDLLILTIEFLLVAVFVTTMHYSFYETSYYDALHFKWNLFNSIIHVWSFWLLLMGIFINLWFYFNRRNHIFTKCKILPYLISFIGIFVIIVYHTLWGNIDSRHKYLMYYHNGGDIFKDFERNARTISENHTLILNFAYNRQTTNMFHYAFLNEAIDRNFYNRIMINYLRENPFDPPAEPPTADDDKYINKKHKFILTSGTTDDLSKTMNKYNVKFSLLWSVGGISYYRILSVPL